MTYENMQEKTDVLIAVYENIHKHIRKNEALENKVSFSVGALFMLFAAFLLKEHIPLSGLLKTILGMMILSMCLSALYFLHQINGRIKSQCRLIVRIETTFGLYEPNHFLKNIPQRDKVRFPTQVFPDQFSDWGEKQRRLFAFPHTLGIVFSAMAAITSLFVDLPSGKQEQNAVSTRSVVAPSGSQVEKYLDIKPRPVGQ